MTAWAKRLSDLMCCPVCGDGQVYARSCDWHWTGEFTYMWRCGWCGAKSKVARGKALSLLKWHKEHRDDEAGVSVPEGDE